MLDRAIGFDVGVLVPDKRVGQFRESKSTSSIPPFEATIGGSVNQNCVNQCRKMVNVFGKALGNLEIIPQIDPAHVFVLYNFVRGAGHQHLPVEQDIGAIHNL